MARPNNIRLTRTQKTILKHLRSGGILQPRNWSTNTYEYFPKRPGNVRRNTLEQMRKMGLVKIGSIRTETIDHGWVLTDQGRIQTNKCNNPLSNKRLTEMLGAIEAIHTVVCDKTKESDRAGDVIVALKTGGKWYEIIRLTERCDYYAGGTYRGGLANSLLKENARSRPPHAGDNWNPYE